LRDLFTKEGNALRILQISSARSIGGGERHLIDLSSGLVERGHEVFVALRKGAPVRQQLTSIAPDHIFEVNLRHALDFGSALKLSRIIRENEIEIVHAHLARDYPLAALAMRHNSDVQLILTRHVLFPLGKIHVLTFLRVSKIIAVSHAVARALSKQPRFPKEKIRIVHNGINIGRIDEQLERFDRESVLGKLGLPLHRSLVASVGELNPLKGHEDFIAAASKIALQNGEVDFGYSLTSAAKNVTLTVSDSSGNPVWTGSGTTTSGDNSFTWDGTKTDGTQLDDGGQYTLSVTATDSGGASVYDSTTVSGTVTSVDFSSSTLKLLIGNTSVSSADVIGVTS